MIWLPIAGYILIAIGYGALPATEQAEWVFAADQWQLVCLAWLAFLCVDYSNTYRKATVAVLLIWTLLIAATDGFIEYPSWGMVPEGLLVAAVLIRTLWKIHALQGHKKT